MNKKQYHIARGFPWRGSWVDPGEVIQLIPCEAAQLLRTQFIQPVTVEVPERRTRRKRNNSDAPDN
ncbi:hypothetical protein [Spartinivicinus ruber]|uniref:hypothetical protein n=1 Tax=Spartinivicinus ruber TaxID=2683272 RepID=UPI0013D57128|nr:hypothetical protein [Spartinivicinus ruber]